MWGKSRRRLLGVITTVAIIFHSGCSSSLFTGGAGTELEALKGSGRFNKNCLGMDFSDVGLDVPTSRALVRCLNSNNSIAEFQALTDSMTDAQVKAIIDVVNEQLLRNPRRLKELDKSLEQMDGAGILDSFFTESAKIFEKAEFLRQSLKLLRQTIGDTGRIDPAVLASIRAMTRDFSEEQPQIYTRAKFRENLNRALEVGIETSQLKSYQALIQELESARPLLNLGQGLEFFSDKMLEYLKAKILAREAYAKVALWGIEDGSLFDAFDHYFTQQCDQPDSTKCDPANSLETHAQVQALEAMTRTLMYEHKEQIFKPLTDLQRLMDGPIECMDSTKKVPNANLFVFDELLRVAPLDAPQHMIRLNGMKLALANSFCEFPRESDKTFNQLFSVLRELAFVQHGRPVVTIAHLLKGLTVGEKTAMSPLGKADLLGYFTYPAEERYRRLLVHLLGDKNKTINIYTHLADLLAEVSRPERNALGNSLYLLNAYPAGSSERADLQRVVRSFMRLRPELRAQNGENPPGYYPRLYRSIYDVFSNAVLKVDSPTLYKVMRGVSEFVDAPTPMLNPILVAIRKALLVNDVNPGIEIAIELGLNAEKYEGFFQTLFDVSDSDRFVSAMRLSSKMATEGSLKELLQGILTMFRGSTRNVPGVPVVSAIPGVAAPDPAHDQSTRERPDWNPLPARWPQNASGVQACLRMDLDLPLSKPQNPGWNAQLQAIAACSNANGQNEDFEKFIHYGLERKMPSGKSVLSFLVEKAANLIPERSSGEPIPLIYDELGDLMTDAQSYRDMKDMTRASYFWLDKKYCSVYRDTPGFTCPSNAERVSVAQGLLRGLGALNTHQGSLQQTLELVADLVTNPHLPRSVALLYDLDTDADQITQPVQADAKPPLVSYPLNNFPFNRGLENSLKASIRQYEKREPTDAVLREKYDAFWKEPQPSKLSRYQDYAGRTRIGFAGGAQGARAFKAVLRPLLDQTAIGDRLAWMLRFFYYMDDHPYTAEWWADWFHRAASNVRAIPFFPPGTYPEINNPTVKLVSQLDMMDLIVHEADFALKDYGQFGFGIVSDRENFAIKYLSLIAQSGSDMTGPIDAMRRDLDFFGYKDGLAARIGFALDKEVKRRLFNMNMVFPVMRETNRVTEFTMPDGQKLYLNDLGILRDLFKRVLSATPAANRNMYERENNSLNAINALTGFGLMRNVTTSMWYVGENQRMIPQDIAHLLRFLVRTAVVRNGESRELNPNMLAAMNFLLREDCDRSKPQFKNLPCVPTNGNDPRVEFDDRYVFLGKLINEVFEWMSDDDRKEDLGQTTAKTLMKRSGYLLTRLLDRLDQTPDRKSAELPKKLAVLLKATLGTEKGTKFLAENFGLIKPFFVDNQAPHFLQLLLDSETSRTQRDWADYTDQEAFASLRSLAQHLLDELAKNQGGVSTAAVDLADALYRQPGFKAGLDALDWMDEDPDYKEFRSNVSDRVMANVIHWLPKESTTLYPRQLRPRLQRFLQGEILNGSIQELLVFAGNESTGERADRLYNEIKFLGTPEYIGKTGEFLDLIKLGIVDAYPATRR